MANERLRAAISAKGETIQSVAQHVGVDPKSVERWITTNRTPHRGHRWKAASFLGADEVYLWPSVEKQAETASTSELITYYPHRGAVPAALWSSLIEKATDEVGILVYAGLFLFDSHPDLPDQLAEKAKAGAQVRILLGDPDSEAVRQRGEEEGIGDDLAARARISRRYLQPAMSTPGVEVRLHDTILYNSLYRFDDDVLVNPHVLGAPAGQNPVMHFRYIPGARTFRHYMRSFDYAWERGREA
ncbi:XRE family transcriptional regulator [Streptomyces sp. WAC 00631]|uniref:XRE family transcriptional regulator n=1 Tax=Streptomyces sp. WAC 00631 TaxID=2203201 RepID=UPI000F7716CE|nr:XRE family transcriptional regulator [Streptomyces sp. WAC 00631]MCC5032908.1 XRE family transcriptional regulator [Streptomyces sp. WAC 00631]